MINNQLGELLELKCSIQKSLELVSLDVKKVAALCNAVPENTPPLSSVSKNIRDVTIVENDIPQKNATPTVKNMTTNGVKNFSMKFPKPKSLLVNEYPDSTTSQPELLKSMVQEIIFPQENSKMGNYVDTTIKFIKEQKKERAQKASLKVVKVHYQELGRKLYFVDTSTTGITPYKEISFRALVDTGAANSLIHMSLVKELGLKYKPAKMVLATASGLDDTAIKGILHLKFALKTSEDKIILSCANFIVTTKLNGLQSIIGA